MKFTKYIAAMVLGLAFGAYAGTSNMVWNVGVANVDTSGNLVVSGKVTVVGSLTAGALANADYVTTSNKAATALQSSGYSTNLYVTALDGTTNLLKIVNGLITTNH